MFCEHNSGCIGQHAVEPQQPHPLHHTCQGDRAWQRGVPAAKSPQPPRGKKGEKQTGRKKTILESDSEEEWAGELVLSPLQQYFVKCCWDFSKQAHLWFTLSSYSKILLIMFWRKRTGIVVNLHISNHGFLGSYSNCVYSVNDPLNEQVFSSVSQFPMIEDCGYGNVLDNLGVGLLTSLPIWSNLELIFCYNTVLFLSYTWWS